MMYCSISVPKNGKFIYSSANLNKLINIYVQMCVCASVSILYEGISL
ncbi:unnamed protein product [Brugia timori]|uniref:Uncharacterized protein n=1 Tax=Brugia timori TaxID=42155 RepID=A0A0R3QW82_9BILA|nr:unnamed protein product [Brugia timori]